MLLERELKRSSGYGKQVAIVHTINSAIPNINIVLATFKTPVPWDAADNKPVKLAVLVIAPPRRLNDYFSLIQSVSRILAEDSIRLSIESMNTPSQIMTVINAVRNI